MRLALAAAACCAALALPAQADYFLDAAQKGELLSRGQITGHDDQLYNVWIVPGYVGPWEGAREGWRDAGRDLKEYGSPKLYRGMAEHGRAVNRFARRNIIRDFSLRGTRDTWKTSWSTASTRVDKRVFGWWFAYPWSLMESSGASVLRLGLGLPTGAVVAVGAYTVLPLAELAAPTAMAGYHATVPGFAVPLVAASWNTVIAPPLALFGEQPSPERADGFWMKRIDPVTADSEFARLQADLAIWRTALLATPEAAKLGGEREALVKQLQAERQEALKQLDAQQKTEREKLAAQQRDHYAQAAQSPALPAPDRARLEALAQRYGRQPLADSLKGADLDAATAAALIDVLLGPDSTAPQTVTPDARRDGEKTDPVRRSFELLDK